jgi:ABC-type transport system substrate-binding protein
MLGRLYVCSAKRLGSCNPEYDTVMTQAAQELDSAKREQLLKDGQKILWDDAPAIWPFELTATAAWRERVQGFSTPPNVVPDFRSVKLS